jgi:hypothetical protein
MRMHHLQTQYSDDRSEVTFHSVNDSSTESATTTLTGPETPPSYRAMYSPGPPTYSPGSATPSYDVPSMAEDILQDILDRCEKLKMSTLYTVGPAGDTASVDSYYSAKSPVALSPPPGIDIQANTSLHSLVGWNQLEMSSSLPDSGYNTTSQHLEEHPPSSSEDTSPDTSSTLIC